VAANANGATSGFWPPHASEMRPWRSASRAGGRADRTLTEIEVSLPPMIAELDYELPAGFTAANEAAIRAVSTVDESDPNHIEALSGVLLRMEAVSSSKIEYVEASMNDYARASVGIKANESATSMVAATRAIADMIRSAGETRVISIDEMLAAHETLMRDDPYDGPYAGKFRAQQNWIGGSDYSPRGAIHVPPPPETVERYMDDLMEFANRDDVPTIAQAAIVHAQFESIHPFTDGNGRLGRALINAVLRRRGLTNNVVIPIASALAADRERYFALVNNYRLGELDAFVKELITATRISAQEAEESAKRIGELPAYWATITNTRSASAASSILEQLTRHPILTTEDATRLAGGSTSSTYSALERLEADGVIHEVTKRQRNRVWGATEVLIELDRLSGAIAERMRAARRDG
jgi:Fic family protein